MSQLGRVLAAAAVISVMGCEAGATPPRSPEPTKAPVASSSAGAMPAVAPASRRPLRIALFPYIPDVAHDQFKALLGLLETEFEKQNPNIDLTLRPLDPDNKDEPFYTPATVSGWLTATSGEAYDVVEVDMEMLDQLTKSAAEPWLGLEKPLDDWHAAAAAAVSAEGKTWAFPHMLCGHFLITRDATVAGATNAAGLAKAVSSSKPARLVGDFGGSWNLPSLFLDAYADTYGSDRVAAGIAATLDKTVATSLSSIAHLCAPSTSNECTDTFHNNSDQAVDLFAKGEATAYLGYSEALHRILTKRTDTPDLKVVSAPLGGGSHPVLFTDGLVLRKGCADDCQRDARAFANFLTSSQFNEVLLMSKDGSGAKPRYLLPASKAAFHISSVETDPYYPLLEKEIAAGKNFPNAGFVDAKAKMKKDLLAVIAGK